ncbi:MAG: histidine phosphatase family protein [Lentisphaeria bacterium]|nr:histidine phosphatase family protein [Lentisphaeria bacterium]
MSISDVCEIIAVRHGETVANKTGVLQGQFNTALNEVGLMQADAIAARLKNRYFDIAYSSDLDRAMITGQKIVAYHPGLELLPSPELREWNLGKLQGREYKDLIVEYPEVMQAFKKGGSPDVPEGESVAEFHLRITTFLDRIAAENTGKRVLLVSHGGAMQRILVHAMGQIADKNIRPLCDNASLSVFKCKAGQWQLVTWNDVAHLEDIGTHNTLTF